MYILKGEYWRDSMVAVPLKPRPALVEQLRSAIPMFHARPGRQHDCGSHRAVLPPTSRPAARTARAAIQSFGMAASGFRE